MGCRACTHSRHLTYGRLAAVTAPCDMNIYSSSNSTSLACSHYTTTLTQITTNKSMELFLCNNFCNYYNIFPTRTFFFVMLLPLACPSLQGNRPKNLLCKVILLQFVQNYLNSYYTFFVIVMAAMVLDSHCKMTSEQSNLGSGLQ